MSRQLTSFSLASVNMGRRNLPTHALLNSNITDHIIFMQEPWFAWIGTARSNLQREGVDVLGVAANPKWDIIYPSTRKPDERVKVVTYLRLSEIEAGRRNSRISASSRTDLCAHPSLQMLDIRIGKEVWRALNFYNDVSDPSALDTLTALDLDPTIPTILVGDFNTHSPVWSTPGWAKSPLADRLEAWLASQTFSLLSEPGKPTRRGTTAANERDSVLDLIWINLAAEQMLLFALPEVDWLGSLGSDHTLLRCAIYPNALVPWRPKEEVTGYKIDSGKIEEWLQALEDTGHFLGIPPMNTITDIDLAVDVLFDAIETASSATFERRRPTNRNKCSRWWNPDCEQAVRDLKEAPTDEEWAAATKKLKKVTKLAKRKWADEYIEKTGLWDLAKWRHGRRVTRVSALRNQEGGLVFDHADMAEALSRRFFNDEPALVEEHFHDDPPPVPQRGWVPIGPKEIEKLLLKTSNTASPGLSGVGYQLLKWSWGLIKDYVAALFNACATLHYHPTQWKRAVIAVIPKPDRKDYALPKNYRPIALLETFGKLLEKVMARRILAEVTRHNLVPTTQFGGRNASSCTDAGLALIHDVTLAHRANRKCGMLLFDIQGFFDNVNHARLASVMSDLGFPSEIHGWTESFLKDRRVRLRFNGALSEERDLDVGTPQGSPISPVLSVIYTSPLLHRMRGWNNSSLGMYIDDGVIFACAETWEGVSTLLRARYAVCLDWLARAGLAIEPDKTELLFFRKPGGHNVIPPPAHLFLPAPSISSYYKVLAAPTVRYLGFFINHKLDWTEHVNIMCNRARASLKALQLLGNSIRGLSAANWRLVFNAVCLPVLTYGCQLWFTGQQKTLIKKLQVVQNEGVKIIAGAFRTAPRDALHEHLRIFPMHIRINMLTKTSALRLYRLPNQSQLLCRLGSDWHKPSQDDLPSPVRAIPPKPGPRARISPLEALARRVPAAGPRCNELAVAPWEAPNWGRRLAYCPKANGVSHDGRRAAIRLMTEEGDPAVALVHVVGLITNRGRRDGKFVGAAAAVIPSAWPMTKDHDQAYELGEGISQFDIDAFGISLAARAIRSYLSDGGQARQFIILSRSQSAISRMANHNSRAIQEHTLNWAHVVSLILNTHADVSISVEWTPADTRLRGFCHAMARAQQECAQESDEDLAVRNVLSATFQKAKSRAEALEQWAREWFSKPRTSHAYRLALSKPPDGFSHPLWAAALKAKLPPSRSTFCTALRLAVGHSFTAEYTRRFKRDFEPLDVICECGSEERTLAHIVFDCHLSLRARNEAQIDNRRIRPSIYDLFDSIDGAKQLFKFLEQAPSAHKPSKPPWLPGVPRLDPSTDGWYWDDSIT